MHTKLFYDKHMNTSHEDTILMIKTPFIFFSTLLVLLVSGKYASNSIMALHHDLTFIIQTEVNSKARPRNESGKYL